VNNVMSFVCQELPVPKSLSAPPPPDVHVLDPNAASFLRRVKELACLHYTLSNTPYYEGKHMWVYFAIKYVRRELYRQHGDGGVTWKLICENIGAAFEVYQSRCLSRLNMRK